MESRTLTPTVEQFPGTMRRVQGIQRVPGHTTSYHCLAGLGQRERRAET